MAKPKPGTVIDKIVGVRLPRSQQDSLWDVSMDNGSISAVAPHDSSNVTVSDDGTILDARSCLLAPSLCHAHIHLDKCFLLQDPKFADLEIIKGDFDEAMSITSDAKRRFDEEDLLRRGERLIEESLQFGVTHMRAFVELDGHVGSKCLDTGLKLRDRYRERCDIQICAFAQLPCFSGPDGGVAVRTLMEQAASREGVDVVGSTPYVEDDLQRMRENVSWLAELALGNDKMLDFHMDYHMDEAKAPFIFEALSILQEQKWLQKRGRGIVMGHCTRLTLFQDQEQWHDLRRAIGDLPVTFIALPTSDLFMMRPSATTRGTLNVLDMIRQHDFQAAIAVNNVGNAFTPQGSCDPLALASMCVGVYQAGTKGDVELLYECVSTRAKAAVGFGGKPEDMVVVPGGPADFVLFERNAVQWRTRKSIAEVVYDAGARLATIKGGRLSSINGASA